MRLISALPSVAVLASCTAAPPGPQPPPNPRAMAELQRVTAGRVPQPEVSCIPHYNANEMSVVDGRTLAFNQSMGTVYIAHLSPGCEMVSSPGYALLSRQYGATGLCRNDLQEVVDTMGHMTVGSCTIAAIIPYKRRP